MKRTSLHNEAREIFEAALRSVDARAAIQHAITLNNSLLKAGDIEIDISGRPIYLVAIGKASATMAAGLTDVLGERITQGIVCGPTHQALHPQTWSTFAGGHPLPTEESIVAARSVLRLLANAENEALVFFLISGGGSAMFELPINERITIDELREANRQLVSCGATIAEINAVRRTFSAVKGGKLALAA
ncbi:MAG TPA: glycerate-2-kinase family protein, partial [Pyrinomonadaceae bacterium]|nr:glycerate-2-kinase family protein [Pyrinomonadaceae bacterium]